jgi:transposase InsO family protein
MRRGSKATVASALLGNCVSQGCVSEQKEFAKPFCGRVCARYRKTYRVTTDSNHRKPDVGRLYLAAIVDLGTRRIVGWAMSERMREASLRRVADGVLAWQAGHRTADALGSLQPTRTQPVVATRFVFVERNTFVRASAGVCDSRLLLGLLRCTRQNR